MAIHGQLIWPTYDEGGVDAEPALSHVDPLQPRPLIIVRLEHLPPLARLQDTCTIIHGHAEGRGERRAREERRLAQRVHSVHPVGFQSFEKRRGAG
jgi:hypothetical protein